MIIGMNAGWVGWSPKPVRDGFESLHACYHPGLRRSALAGEAVGTPRELADQPSRKGPLGAQSSQKPPAAGIVKSDRRRHGIRHMHC